MPSGRTHDRIATLVAVPLTVFVYFDSNLDPGKALATLAGFALGSYFLSPDLDSTAAMEGNVGARWGWFKALWFPYTILVPHRHWASHSGFSVFLRVGYLLLHLWGVVVLGSVLNLIPGRQILGVAWFWIRANLSFLGYLALGLLLSDVLHSVSDLLSTWGKRHVYHDR